MTSKKVIQTRGRKKYLAAAIPLIIAAQANAVEFNFGEVEMSLDTQLTLGSSWRMEKQDADLIKGIVGSETNAANNNDGDLNFENGDAFSQVFKGTHDFQISYENYGAFVRGKYWYDAALEDGTAADGSAFSDENGSDYAKFSGAQILDAFVYGEFELGEMPLDLRLGKQVLSWGESTFIQGGINQTNPFDVSALRRPGAELKEGLIPVNMAFASLGVTENLSAEAFYQIGHQETVTPHCGTFFSTNDYQPEGCGPVETAVGKVERSTSFGVDGIKSPDGDGQFGVAFRYFSDALDTEFGLFGLTVDSRVPLISGENSTFNELGFLLSTPAKDAAQAALGGASFTQAVTAQVTAAVTAEAIGLYMAENNETDAAVAQAAVTTAATGTATVGVLSTLMQADAASAGTYLVEYPEDQKIIGLSFATNVAGMALSGELTHKLDVPFQINSAQLLAALLTSGAIHDATLAGAMQANGAALTGEALANSAAAQSAAQAAGWDGVSAPDAAQSGAAMYAYLTGDASDLGAVGGATVQAARDSVEAKNSSLGLESIDGADGQYINGYKMFDVTQAQVTAIKLFDQVLGANRYALVAEAGYTYVHDFDEDGDVKFDGNGAGLDTVTEGSWGYRLRVSGDYSDVFAGVNLSPVFSFSHDVEGVAPAPGGNFVEDQQVIGLALNAEYANMYTASVSYTMYEGGLTNNLGDRDNAAITLGVQF